VRAKRIALTQSDVDELTIKAHDRDDVWIYDAGQDGLAIRLRRGELGISKTWYVTYQSGGQDRRHKLGSASDYRLADARFRAYGIRRDVADGKDPAEERAERVAKAIEKAPTLIEAAVELIKRREGVLRRNTLRGYPRYLAGPYFETLHNSRLDKITLKQIAACLDRVQDVGAFGKPSKSAAKQAREALCVLYDFAASRGWVEPGFNPARATENPLPKKLQKTGDRVLSDAELVEVWNTAGESDYGRIVRLAILLGNRREEIGGMKWAELKDGVWHLPAERTKTNEAREIPLPAAALAIIGEQPAGRTYVFGSTDKSGFSDWSKSFRKLDERLIGKLDAPFRLHDLRRTMRTRLHRPLRIEYEVAEAMIGHRKGRLDRTYIVEKLLPDQRDGFAMWADYVLGLVSGKIKSLAA